MAYHSWGSTDFLGEQPSDSELRAQEAHQQRAELKTEKEEARRLKQSIRDLRREEEKLVTAVRQRERIARDKNEELEALDEAIVEAGREVDQLARSKKDLQGGRPATPTKPTAGVVGKAAGGGGTNMDQPVSLKAVGREAAPILLNAAFGAGGFLLVQHASEIAMPRAGEISLGVVEALAGIAGVYGGARIAQPRVVLMAYGATTAGLVRLAREFARTTVIK